MRCWGHWTDTAMWTMMGVGEVGEVADDITHTMVWHPVDGIPQRDIPGYDIAGVNINISYCHTAMLGHGARLHRHICEVAKLERYTAVLL